MSSAPPIRDRAAISRSSSCPELSRVAMSRVRAEGVVRPVGRSGRAYRRPSGGLLRLPRGSDCRIAQFQRSPTMVGLSGSVCDVPGRLGPQWSGDSGPVDRSGDRRAGSAGHRVRQLANGAPAGPAHELGAVVDLRRAGPVDHDPPAREPHVGHARSDPHDRSERRHRGRGRAVLDPSRCRPPGNRPRRRTRTSTRARAPRAGPPSHSST